MELVRIETRHIQRESFRRAPARRARLAKKNVVLTEFDAGFLDDCFYCFRILKGRGLTGLIVHFLLELTPVHVFRPGDPAATVRITFYFSIDPLDFTSGAERVPIVLSTGPPVIT